MLVKMSDILVKAKKGKYGVPAIPALDESTARAAIESAEKMQSPVILLVTPSVHPDLFYFGRMLRDIISKTTAPVALCLDHSSTFESAIEGIRAGLNCIMVDRSSLPFEENVAQVKELTKIAHAVGVEVEAELGHVGSGENLADYETGLTVPDEAVRYVQETNVDFLAVAIGTAHGVYKGTPKLRFDLLEEIVNKVHVPLVLHGGSGTGDENLAKLCQNGITKVNVANEIFRGAYDACVADGLEGNRVYRLYSVLKAGYMEVAMHKMKVLGCAGKAPFAKGGNGADSGEWTEA